ncbi:ribonuclease H-like domain-containing protein [Tanacetum coccineum]
MTNAKEMWEAIKFRFGGNDESKKMQKYILKQQFESFFVSNSEGLHKGYDRFQSLLSQLEIHGAGLSTEDANQKFLRSLPASWSQVSLIMRTKPGVNSLSFDDLYNNLRVFEPDVKGSTGSSSSAQNVAFVSSSTSSTNDVNTAYEREVSLSYSDELISKGNQESRRRDARNTGYKAKDNRRRLGKQEEPKALVTLDGDGVDWTGHAENEQENFALMAYSSSGSNTEISTRDKSGLLYGNQINKGVLSYEKEVLKSVFDIRSSNEEDSPVNDRFAKVEGMHASKTSESDAKTSDTASCESNSSIETPDSVPKPVVNEPIAVSKSKVWSDAPIIEEYESDSDDEYVIEPSKEQEKPSFAFVNTVKHVKTPRETVKEQNTYSSIPKADKRDWNGLMSKKLGLGYGFTKKACFVCGSFSHLIRDCDFHEKRMAKQVELNKQKGKATGQGENRPVWNNVQRLNHQNKFVPKAVLTKTGIFPVNAARQNPSSQAAETSTARKVNTARPIVNEIRQRNNFYKSHSPIRRPFNKSTAPKANFTNHKVNTAGDKTVSAVRGYRETAVKTSAGCNWRPKRHYWNKVSKYNSGSNSNKNDDPQKALKNKGIVDKKMSSSSKGYISGKGKIKTRKLDFEDVCFVKELQHFNLFSVSQMCDKKNKVLFTDTECPKEANHSAGTQYNIDAEIEAEPAQEYFVLPLWSSYTLTVKSSEAKNGDVKPNGDTSPKTNEEPKDQEDLAFLEELERLKRQENEANNEAEAFRKEFAQYTEDLLLQARAARATSTNTVNTISTPISTASPSNVFSIGGPDLNNNDQDDSQIPALEDTYENPSDGILSMHLMMMRFKQGAKYTKVLELMLLLAIFKAKKENNAQGITALIFLAFAFYMGFIVYQMDVKSAFLYGTIDEEVYMSQPPGFVDPKFPKKVYKVVKALYHLHQAPRAWYEILKKFDFASVKIASTLIKTQKPLTKDEEADDVDVTPKTSQLHAVKRIFRYLKGHFHNKGCQFLSKLISWQCKKQTIMATSTTEAEYVAAANCCGQVLWIQNQMLDYGFNFMNTKIYIDNESTICIVKNSVFHSKTKHIEIRHHFIREAYEKKLIQVLKIYTDDNVADLLTKAFNVNSSQTVNDEKQIHATIDSKAVVVTEASIRSSLLLNDARATGGKEGIRFVNTMIVSLGVNTSERAEGGLNLKELLSLCTNLLNRVLALETAKDAQAAKILKLKTRIKKLEKKCKPNILTQKGKHGFKECWKMLSNEEKLEKEGTKYPNGKKSRTRPTLDALDDLR